MNFVNPETLKINRNLPVKKDEMRVVNDDSGSLHEEETTGRKRGKETLEADGAPAGAK